MNNEPEIEIEISFVVSGTLHKRVQANLEETWSYVDEDPPTFEDVFNDALARIAADIRDELDEQAQCQHVDTCQAQVMIKRALAAELDPKVQS